MLSRLDFKRLDFKRLDFTEIDFCLPLGGDASLGRSLKFPLSGALVKCYY